MLRSEADPEALGTVHSADDECNDARYNAGRRRCRSEVPNSATIETNGHLCNPKCSISSSIERINDVNKYSCTLKYSTPGAGRRYASGISYTRDASDTGPATQDRFLDDRAR